MAQGIENLARSNFEISEPDAFCRTNCLHSRKTGIKILKILFYPIELNFQNRFIIN